MLQKSGAGETGSAFCILPSFVRRMVARKPAADKEKDIKNNVAQILAENGLEGKELVFGSSKESIAISDAFPQIFERKNSINVKI